MKTRQFFLFLALTLAALSAGAQGLNNLKLSEVLLSDTSGVVGGQPSQSGWIEIYNNSWSTVDLGGCYLTNNPAALGETLSAPERIALMKQIPTGDGRTKLAPKKTFIVYADGMPNLGLGHIGFTLTPGQDNVIALYTADGKKLIDQVTVPAAVADGASYAVVLDEDNAVTKEWKVCNGSEVTPNTINSAGTPVKDKVAEFKQNDPHGFAMAILGMGIVIGGLALLWLFFSLFGAIMRKVTGTTEAPAQAEAPKAPSAKVGDDAVIAAVIGMALYEMEQDAHDEESGVITIIPTDSPWKQRGIMMAESSR